MRNSNGGPVQNSAQKFENHTEISKYEWMTQLKQHSGGVGAVCQMAKKRPLISIHSRQIYPGWTRPTWLCNLCTYFPHKQTQRMVNTYILTYVHTNIYIYMHAVYTYIYMCTNECVWVAICLQNCASSVFSTKKNGL